MPSLRTIGSGLLAPIFGPLFLLGTGFFEDDIVISFFNKLNDAKLGDSPHDIARWDLDSERDFMVKSYYLKLLQLNFSSLNDLFKGGFPHKLMWRSLALLKVSFFCLEGIAWEDFNS